MGAINTLLMILDGLSHGFAEGAWPTMLIALAAIGVPAAAAVRQNLRWIKAAGAGQA